LASQGYVLQGWLEPAQLNENPQQTEFTLVQIIDLKRWHAQSSIWGTGLNRAPPCTGIAILHDVRFSFTVQLKGSAFKVKVKGQKWDPLDASWPTPKSQLNLLHCPHVLEWDW
jgi:hypothetical protein